MSGGNNKTPVHRTGTDMHIDKLLPGEILTLPLPQFVEGPHVDDLMTTARRRFGGQNGVWLIVATEIKTVNEEARGKLRAGFAEFAKNGGKHVLLVSNNTSISNLFRFMVIAAVSLQIQVFPDNKGALEASKKLRAKPAPPR